MITEDSNSVSLQGDSLNHKFFLKRLIYLKERESVRWGEGGREGQREGISSSWEFPEGGNFS